MQVPVIHGFFCVDHDPIEEWQPEDPSDVDVRVDVYIGPDENPSGMYFTAHITTSKILRTGMYKNYLGPEIEEYSWAGAKNWIESYVAGCAAYSWEQVIDNLRKRLYWEYEGMH